ncbi:hypothetical protein [uncultured Erythrobacter sp.]|uniref:hypothetical protein n=1 Tax=uncultured Erythrobacter sp. TaxID=263913 RepID=UPI0026395F7D|nr:hypothetical protein [uncultured Erythrobacter sp.]
MALMVLIVLGALLGWMASILARTEEPGEILRQMGLSLLAALIAGLIANQGTVLGGLSLIALGAACAAALVVLVLYHAVLRKSEA